MKISKKSKKFITRVLIFYCLLLVTIFFTMYSRNNTGVILTGDYAYNDLSLFEILVFYFYKYILNFPAGFINWFTDKLLFTTPIFALINAVILSLLIIRRKPERRGSVSTLVTFSSYILLALITLKLTFYLLDRMSTFLEG